MSKLIDSIKAKINKKYVRYLPATVIILGFAVVGIILTVASHAATYQTPKEAEAGTIAGAAGAVSDATAAKASGASYVKFGNGTGTGTTPPTPPPTTMVPNGNIPGPWTLTFSDEFDGTSLNKTTWTADSSAGNNPDETSCFDPNNFSVSDGMLNMPLLAKSCQGKPNMGAQIYTTTFKQAYGFFEARLNIPGSNGKTYNFPAFWLLPQACWPTGGEIDIMETIGGGAKQSYASPTSCNGQPPWQQINGGSGDWSGWHTFAVDWEPGKITGYYDGKSIGTMTQNISSTPMSIFLDQDSRPMGGQTVTGVTLKADYIRAWKKG